MPTLQQLDALADQVPVMNQKAAKKAQAATSYNLQNQVAAAPAAPGVSLTQAAQTAAPTAVTAHAAPAVQAAQQTQAQLGQVAQVGLQAKQTADSTALATQARANQEEATTADNAARLQAARSDLAMRKRVTGAEQAAARRLQSMGIELDTKVQLATIRQREQLSRLGGDVRDKILDARLRFDRDEMGRRFTNERQLADYTLASARSDIELKDKLREMQQTQDRKVQLLEMAERRIREAIQQGFVAGQQQLDNQHKAKLAQIAADMRKKIQKEKAKANANNAMITGAFTIAGAVIGGVWNGGLGAPAGAMLGASVGQGVGSMVAGASQSQG